MQWINGKALKCLDYIPFIYIFIGLSGVYPEISVPILAVLMALFFVGVVLNKKNWGMFNNKAFLWLGLFLVDVFISGCFNGWVVSLKNTVNIAFIHFSLFFFFYYVYNHNEKQLFKLTCFTFFVLMGLSISSIIQFSADPNLPIKISQLIEYNAYFVGELYGLFIALSVLTPFLVSIILIKKNLPSYITLGLSVCVFIFLFSIYKSRSSLAFLVTLFGCLLALWIGESSSYKNTWCAKKWILCTGFLVLIYMYCFDRGFLGEFLMNISSTKSSKLLQRLYEMGTFLADPNAYAQNMNDMSRLSLLLSSLKVFKAHWLFGVNHLTAGNYFSLQALGVGMHNTFFDTLASYGMVGFAFYIFGLYYAMKPFLKNHFFPLWIVLGLISSFINPYREFSVFHIQLFLIPSLYILIKESNYEDICNAIRIS